MCVHALLLVEEFVLHCLMFSGSTKDWFFLKDDMFLTNDVQSSFKPTSCQKKDFAGSLLNMVTHGAAIDHT